MRDARRLERPIPEIGALEYLVDGVEDVGQRAETVAQRHRGDLEMRGAGAEGILPSGLDEHLRVGPLEREDRLLLVAHREQRARSVGGAVTEEEVVDQRPHHLPLQRVGVLPLVDQDMAQPRIELVAHPVALLFVAQQRRQLFDQVVEIEQRAGPLLLLVIRRDRRHHVEHRLAARHQLGAHQLLVRLLEPLPLGDEARRDLGDQHGRRLLDQRLACRAIGLRQEGVEEVVGVGSRRVDLAEPIDEVGAIGIGGDQCKDLCMVVSAEAVARADLGHHLVDAADIAHQLQQFAFGGLAPRQHRPQRALLVERLEDGGLDLEIAEQAEQRFHRRRFAAAAQAGREHRLARFQQHAVALVFFEYAEIERHPGLAREAVQHALAKRVDGLDAQAARCFERPREQRAGPQPHCRRRRHAAQRGQVLD